MYGDEERGQAHLPDLERIIMAPFEFSEVGKVGLPALPSQSDLLIKWTDLDGYRACPYLWTFSRNQQQPLRTCLKRRVVGRAKSG